MKPGKFFSTTLSSHIVPVIFAIGVLFIAERKFSGTDNTKNEAAVLSNVSTLTPTGAPIASSEMASLTNEASSSSAISAFSITPAIIALGGVSNVQQVIALGRVSGLLMKIIR